MLIGIPLIIAGLLLSYIYIRYVLGLFNDSKPWVKVLILLLSWDSLTMLSLGGLLILFGLLKSLGLL